MTESTRLTDTLGVIALDGTDYADDEQYQTTIGTEYLRDSLDLIETLGWESVDVLTVNPTDDDKEPLLLLRPRETSLFGGLGQAGIVVAPRISDLPDGEDE